MNNRRNNKGTILCLTFNNFPNKDAGSVRLLAIAKALIEAGYEIKVISMGKDAPDHWQKIEEKLFHMSVRNTNDEKISLLKSYLQFNSFVNKEIEIIKDIKAVFAFNVMFYVIDNKYLKKLGVPLIYDSTEWYNACEFKQGIFSPEYISNSIIVNHKIRKPWKVIAISRLLENHYKSRRLVVKRIPAVMDVNAFPSTEYTSRKIIKVIYAGSPGKKDALHLIIQGFASLPLSIRNRFCYKIIGVTKEEFADNNKLLEIPSNVVFMGKVTREKVIEELNTADFTTFMRDSRLRFVNAGFPSKLAESMSAGVPVITNLTSDLSEYLVNGVNSVIVDEFSSDKYAKALTVVATLTPNKIVEMHKAAKITAKRFFDYSNFINDLEDLIKVT